MINDNYLFVSMFLCIDIRCVAARARASLLLTPTHAFADVRARRVVTSALNAGSTHTSLIYCLSVRMRYIYNLIYKML